jgi:hypothetical protein
MKPEYSVIFTISAQWLFLDTTCMNIAGLENREYGLGDPLR